MATLIEVQPLILGSRVTLRACSVQDRAFTALGGEIWWPAIPANGLPSLGIQLFDGDFSSDIDPGTASFSLLLDKLEKLNGGVDSANWAGADVVIYHGSDPSAWPWDSLFEGKIDRFEREANRIAITARVDQSPFEVDALTDSYAGTTGLEGPAELKGTPKPWVFGVAKNVEPVLIDTTDNVFQFSAYGQIKAVDALYERGSAFAASVGNYANFAALVAADIPEGRYGTCLAQGLVRLGAPAYGVITGDIQGDAPGGTLLNYTGEIIERIYDEAGISSSLIDSDSMSALDTAVPYPINIAIFEQEQAISLAKRLTRPCNAQCGVSWTRKLFAVRPTIGTAVKTLDADGRALPRVISNSEANTSAPYKRLEMTAERCWRVHSLDEIASDVNLIEVGLYDAGKTYRDGNIVTAENGARWLYINAEPSSGNALAEGAYWALLSAAPTTEWDSVADSGGTKPDDNADVTGDNVASGISGQGALATKNVVTASTIGKIQVGSALADQNFSDESYWAISGGGTFVTSDPLLASLGAPKAYRTSTGNGTTSQANEYVLSLGGFQEIPVAPGDIVYLKGDVALPDGFTGRTRLRLIFLDKSGAGIGFPFVIGVNYRTLARSGDTVETIEGRITAPANARFMRVYSGEVDWSTTQNNAGYALFEQCAVYRIYQFGAGTIVDENGNTVTDASAITAFGIASGITGQQKWATLTQIGLDDPDFINVLPEAKAAPELKNREITLTGGDRISMIIGGEASPFAELTLPSLDVLRKTGGGIAGGLAGIDDVYFGSPLIRETDGGATASLSNFKTGLGIASGFTGQAALATQNTVLPSQFKVYGPNLIQDPNFDDSAYWSLAGGAGYSASGWLPSIGATRGIQQSGNGTTSQSNSYATSQRFRPQPGGTIRIVQSYRLTDGFTGYLLNWVAFYDYNGDLISNESRSIGHDYRTTALSQAGSPLVVRDAVSVIDVPTNCYDAHLYAAHITWSDTQNNAGTCYAAVPRVENVTILGTGQLVDDGGNELVGTDVVTGLGIASAIAGQGDFATLNSAGYGSAYLTGFDDMATYNYVSFNPASGAGYQIREDGATGALGTLANFKTGLGIASAIAGQGDFATISQTQLNNSSRFSDSGRVGRLNTAGYAEDSTVLRPNMIAGLRSVTSGYALSDSAGSGNRTINIVGSTFYRDDGTSISYPSGSITGIPYSATRYVTRTHADLASGTGTGYSAHTSLSNAIRRDRVYLGYITVADSGGAGGGGGVGGGDGCVVTTAIMPCGARAGDIVPGNRLLTLEPDMESLGEAIVEASEPDENECVRIVFAGGKSLTLALNTPINLRNGGQCIAANAWRHDMRVSRDGGDSFAWERPIDVEYAGKLAVQRISAGGVMFAAGDTADFMAMSHNDEAKQ